MTDIEFDILDELYFLTSFDELASNLKEEENVLIGELQKMLNKGWVRCMDDVSEDVMFTPVITSENIRKYKYLATKEGLFAHNSRS
ncbi:MAG: transporter [Cytophagaceae bacterium]